MDNALFKLFSGIVYAMEVDWNDRRIVPVKSVWLFKQNYFKVLVDRFFDKCIMEPTVKNPRSRCDSDPCMDATHAFVLDMIRQLSCEATSNGVQAFQLITSGYPSTLHKHTISTKMNLGQFDYYQRRISQWINQYPLVRIYGGNWFSLLNSFDHVWTTHAPYGEWSLLHCRCSHSAFGLTCAAFSFS